MTRGMEDGQVGDSLVEDVIVVEPVTVPETKLDLVDSQRLLEAAMTLP